MGVSKTQRQKIVLICACGCNKEFNPFPVYGTKIILNRVRKNPHHYSSIVGDNGATLYIPKYIRGHNPECRKHQTDKKDPWNKGLTKDVHPSISKIGFQPGHKPFNDWSHVHKLQRNDPKYRKRWLKSKKGQVPWNKDKTKKDYKNGIKTGPNHGNWCGGKNGLRDTAEYKTLCSKVRKRDEWTCQNCGDHNYKGRGSRIILDVHHIIAYSENPKLANDINNLITLCRICHMATENYGTKLIHKRRKQGGK